MSPAWRFLAPIPSEGAAIPSPAAIASAVEDALAPLGIKIRQLPLSPERVWDLMREARATAAAR